MQPNLEMTSLPGDALGTPQIPMVKATETGRGDNLQHCPSLLGSDGSLPTYAFSHLDDLNQQASKWISGPTPAGDEKTVALLKPQIWGATTSTATQPSSKS